MTLDHSSPTTLVRDLNLHQGGLFRFEWASGYEALPPGGSLRRFSSRSRWRLVSATADDWRLCFCVEYLDDAGDVVEHDCWLLNRGLHLAGIGGVWVVTLLKESPDALLRCRLDENLRGVFA